VIDSEILRLGGEVTITAPPPAAPATTPRDDPYADRMD